MDRKVVAMVMPRTGPTLLFAPYNYMALATDLKDRGYTPLILDSRLQDVEAELQKPETKDQLACVCFSSMMGPQLSYGLEQSAWVHEALPGVPTIWGGILPTELPELCATHHAIDYVVLGWGEGRLPDLLDRLGEGEIPSDVSGLVYEADDETVFTGDADVRHHPPLVYDYDSVDLSPFIMEGYGLGRRTLVMITSRGCPHHCTFCYGPQFHESSWTGQEPEQVLADIDLLAKRYDWPSCNTRNSLSL